MVNDLPAFKVLAGKIKTGYSNRDVETSWNFINRIYSRYKRH